MTSMLAHSLDIFDTTLVRIWAYPTDLFWQLGQKLYQDQLIQVSPDQWQRMRTDAETTVRHTVETGEITLQHIYDHLMPICEWSPAQAEAAMSAEICLEQTSLRPIPATQRTIQTLRQQQIPIAFLSDMYLPSDVIQGFLEEHNLWAAGDRLYISGELGINKVSGKLFEHYLSQHNLRPTQLHHTGDNLHSDIQVARSLGIQTTPFVDTHLNRYEQAIANDPQLSLRFRSLLAGASRLCRLQCPETDLHQQTIWNTAANVIAPVLFGFVHFVLEESQKRGIQRLYFMARDGQMLYKMAQIICQKWGYDIDCRYLYGSRQSLHFPAMQELGEVEQTWIFDKPEFLSVRIVCERVNLPPEQISEALTQHGFPSSTWDTNLSEAELTTLKILFQKPEIVEQITTLAAAYRETALNYFRQEGLGDGVPFATVDTGWTGKTQRSLARILTAGHLYPEKGLNGFFFGLTEHHPGYERDRLTPYFMAPYCFDERRFLCDSQIIELFLTADHGTTQRYEQQGDRAVPVLKSQTNDAAIQWGVLVQHRAILRFTELLTDPLQASDCDPTQFPRVTTTLLSQFIHTPSREEANAFGTQAFSQHQSESKFYDLAPTYSTVDGFKMLVNWRFVHSFVWLAASIQRSTPLAKLPLCYIKGLRYSYVYAEQGWRSFGQGEHPQAWKMIQKAIQAFPPILLSRSFLRLQLLLGAQSLLKPKNYHQLRQVVQTVLPRS